MDSSDRINIPVDDNPAKKVNDLKNQFSGMAAHDLRHPLGVFLNCSEILLDEVGGSLSEQHAEFLRLIHTSSTSMLCLLNDLLDIAKIEAGKLNLVIQPTDLIDFLRRVIVPNQLLAKRSIAR